MTASLMIPNDGLSYLPPRMIVTLNEYTLALLCGGVSCLTYIIIHMNDIAENDFSGGKRKKRDSDVSSTASQSSSCNIVADLSNRRQSQISAKFRARRAESIKNDHVFFADEINDDDEKFTPNPGINDSEVSMYCALSTI